jgi:hypothetical protein
VGSRACPASVPSFSPWPPALHAIMQSSLVYHGDAWVCLHLFQRNVLPKNILVLNVQLYVRRGGTF